MFKGVKMNEKLPISIITVFIFVILFFALFSVIGCRSTGSVVVISDEDFIRAQISVERLQRANELSLRGLDSITERGERIEAAASAGLRGIELAIELLGEYDQLFDYIINLLRRIEQETRTGVTPKPEID